MNDRLKEWAMHQLKHKNIFFKNLNEIEDTQEGFIAHMKDKKVRYIIQDNLAFGNLSKEEEVCYVTLNNTKNFSTLVSEWKIIISFPKLRIIFVEKINNGKHWSIIPYTHDKISEKASLKQGLKSLYESVKND